MTSRWTLALACVVLGGVSTLHAQTDTPPQLADQYAEVMLHVDGMI